MMAEKITARKVLTREALHTADALRIGIDRFVRDVEELLPDTIAREALVLSQKDWEKSDRFKELAEKAENCLR